MSKEPHLTDKQKAVATIVAAWNPIFQINDGALVKNLRAWADTYLRQLGEAGAALEIEELLRAGCERFTLALVAWSSVKLCRLPDAYYELMGDPSRLAHLASEFEATAILFDGLSRVTGINDEEAWDSSLGVPSPTQMAAHLRTYQYLDLFKLVMPLFNLRSGKEVERHMPTAYIRHATGEWHDRECAALITASSGVSLDEGTHRAWRNRSFKKIRIDWSFFWQIANIIKDVHDKSY